MADIFFDMAPPRSDINEAPPSPRGKPAFHLIKYSFVVLFSCSTILEAM